MKPYSEFSAEELAMEGLFIRWILFPNDTPIRAFWEKWLSRHPQMTPTVQEARSLVEIASKWNGITLSPEENTSLWTRIRSSMGQLSELDQGAFPGEENIVQRQSNLLLIVVIILLLSIISYSLFKGVFNFSVSPVKDNELTVYANAGKARNQSP